MTLASGLAALGLDAALPVIDAEGKLAGVITADEIISLLREK